MLLVKSRPITLPVWKSGRWYDDFAVTGAAHPGYTLTGTKTKTAYGISIQAPAVATIGALALPTWYKASNFRAEVRARYVAGTNYVGLEFRRIDGNNKWWIQVNSSNQLGLLKQTTAGGIVTVATVTGVTSTDWQRIGVRAIGSKITIFLKGVQVINTDDTTNITGANFRLCNYDAVNGTAISEWQYLAIKPC